MSRISVVHEYGHALSVRTGGVEIVRYVYAEQMPQLEAPKPYFHPIRTLSGAVVSGYRPHDHRWHKGLQLTISHLSGQNFWGGPTYLRDRGYVQLDNVGSMQHERFEHLDARPDRLSLEEALIWRASDGEPWIDERRAVAVHGIDVEQGRWVLDVSTRLVNLLDRTLEVGSPTTHGRTLAGYGGLFWRGPRAWTGGTVHTAGGGGPEAMGTTSPWLAYTGEHDERDGGGTLLVIDRCDPTAARHHWFVRTNPFPAVNPAPAFFEEIAVPPSGSLALSYRVVVGDAIWSRERIEQVAAELTR